MNHLGVVADPNQVMETVFTRRSIIEMGEVLNSGLILILHQDATDSVVPSTALEHNTTQFPPLWMMMTSLFGLSVLYIGQQSQGSI